jgi:putative nucleotidyltransferase with HDIG domain
MADRLERPGDALVRAAWNVTEAMLSEELPNRWQHSQGVLGRAGLAATDLTAEDANVLAQAAILHDVGYASKVAFTGFHPIDGARHLRSIGWDDRVVNLVAHHSCAWVEADQLGLGAAIAEFEPGPPELTDFLIFCDMTTSPDGSPVTVDERLSEIVERYGAESAKARFVAVAGPELRRATQWVARRHGSRRGPPACWPLAAGR